MLNPLANKLLTFEERKQIENLISKGISATEISRILRRSKNCIVLEVRRGGKREYKAKFAQQEAEKRQETRINCLRKRNEGTKVTFKMKQRIVNLEMQLEILYDTVKELLNK